MYNSEGGSFDWRVFYVPSNRTRCWKD